MVVDIEGRDAVLDAFRKAKAANQEAGICYRAAVDAWCELHPDHDHTQAAKEAVRIVHESFGPLQDMATD
jgi:hypothetical protein